MEGEPPGCIHKVADIVADICQPFVQKRTACRAIQHAGILESQCDGCPLQSVITKVNTNVRADITYACLVLNECDTGRRRSTFNGLCARHEVYAGDALDLQRTVELKY